MSGPTYSESWLLWCLALTNVCRTATDREAALAALDSKRRERVQKRIDYIFKHRAIPVGDFMDVPKDGVTGFPAPRQIA